MKNTIRRILSIALAAVLTVVMLSAFTSCSQKKDENKLYVGMECGYAPFNYTQKDDANGAVKISNADGYANGYDVMIAKKIAEALGKELVIVKYEFNPLVNAVKAGTLDLIIAGMSPTAERMKSIDFSDKYYESQLVVVVRKDGKYANAKSLTELSGAKLVAQIGTFHNDALQAQASKYDITASTPMDTFPEMINALKTASIDGYIAEEPGAKADCAATSEFTYIPLVNNSTGFEASAEDVQIAVGLKKGSQYREAINNLLKTISDEERLQMMTKATEWSTGSNVQN